jgi:hypothetical protein
VILATAEVFPSFQAEAGKTRPKMGIFRQSTVKEKGIVFFAESRDRANKICLLQWSEKRRRTFFLACVNRDAQWLQKIGIRFVFCAGSRWN